MAGFGWGLSEETEEYLRGGMVLDSQDGFAQGVFCGWARVESPGSVAVLDLRAACGHWRAAPTAEGLADLVAWADAAGIQHGVVVDQQLASGQGLSAAAASLEQAVEQLFWRDWAIFEHRLEQCRAGQPAGGSGGPVAEQAYGWVVEQLTAEDPTFPALLASDPELAWAIHAEAVRRFGQH